MNRRRCGFCQADAFFGSSPYGATCLQCGRTDPAVLEHAPALTTFLVQRLVAVAFLVLILSCVIAPWATQALRR